MKSNTYIKAGLILTTGMICLASCGILTKSKKKQAAAQKAKTAVQDQVKAEPPAKGPKKFSALITPKSKPDSGLFNIYKQEESYFLEIADSLLNRDILIVSRITKSAADNRNMEAMIGYGGDQINENVVRFDKGPSNKLFMRSISFSEREGDSTGAMYRSVLNSNIQPIVASFEIKGLSKNEKGTIIELTDYLNGDNDILFFGGQAKNALKLAGYQPDKSYIESIHAHPGNIEIKTLKTYGKMPAGPGMPGGGFATYELNSSLVLLPKNPMRPRSADARVGYFTTGYTDFASNAQGIEKVNMITRWRLEPKEADKQRYLAGELVEPQKQIIFYIDPATPKNWVPYLIQGVNDWNKAFEKAGFKNAIVAREAPLNDKNWSLEDAGHSAIVYKPSDIPNASGPHVHDPRTGEILETHVNWYHNIMKLLKNWYFIQASAIDPRARKMQFDEALMGQLIRFVSSHEVGHTLGLRHNYGSSSTVPVEKLRDKNWVEANGHTPSIMDYARFNYVAQPEDGVSEKGIFPRIGDYDLWAIEWGYRWFPEEEKLKEKEKLNKWIIEKTANNRRLWFGTETDPNDPRSQSEDLGNNAMKASAYGIKNLKRILPNIISWSKTPNESYTDAYELYNELLGQYSRYMGHVVKNIGGIMNTPKSVEQPGAVVEYVSKATQQEAMTFLQEQLFITPEWLLNKEMFRKTGAGSINTISRQQDMVLARLLSPATLYKLLQFESYDPQHAYTAGEMLKNLQSGIFKELKSGKSINVYRRNLQKSYVEKLMAMLAPPQPNQRMNLDLKATDISSLVRMQLSELRMNVRSARSKVSDRMSKAHLQDLDNRINDFLKSVKS